MVRAPFSFVQAGQALDLSATEHNAFIRAAKKNEAGLGGLANGANQVTRVRIVNNENFEFLPGQVVRLGEEVRDSTLEDTIVSGNVLLAGTFEGITSNNANPPGTVYAIVEQEIAGLGTGNGPAAVGYGIVSGVGAAHVNILDITHRYARPAALLWSLVSTTDPLSPYVILGEPTGVGIYTVNVLENRSLTVIRAGQTDEIVLEGGSGDVTIYVAGSPEQVDQNGPAIDHVITTYNDWIHGGDISPGLRVYVAYFPDDDKWRIICADCEPQGAPAPPGHGNEIDLYDFGAGTTQGTAKNLGFKSNRITIASATNNAVKLPATADQEEYCHVRNDDGADAIQVFPVTGGFINNQAVNTSESIAAGTGKMYTQVVADHWISS